MGSIHLTPFLGAVIIGWILSVCFHEFCHALTAFLGGDQSVRDKGYLGFNPAAYLDPVMSLLLPAVIMVLGGFPLPGAAVRIDQSALRGRGWVSAVAAAGPAANLILFLLLALILHPALGIADTENPSTLVRFLAVLAMLQWLAILINLIPMPPLDGFGIIEPFLSQETRWKFRRPMVAYAGIFILFFVVFRIDAFGRFFFGSLRWATTTLGLDWFFLADSYNLAFFGG